MLIIVEGPDGSGKTTLVNKIVEKKLAKKIHGTHRNMPNQYILWWTLIDECKDVKNTNYIIDRCFISDWAYRVAVGDDEPYMTLKEMTDLLKFSNVLYIFCDNENSYSLSQSRGEDYINDKSVHDKLRNVYIFIRETIRRFCKEATCITYDFDKHNFDDLCKLLKGG